MMSSTLALEHEVSGDAGAAFGDVVEASSVVVPDGFEAADAAEGGELDEEVGVEVEELDDEVVEAVCCGPVDGGRVPPLLAGALPTKREV